MSLPAPARTVNPPGQRLLACAAVVLAFAVPAAALIALGVRRGSQYSDQWQYHLPTAERFASHWPHIDFSSYPAAMTPGYHLLIAGLLRAGGGEATAQAATLLMTAGLLATLAWWAAARVPAADAVLLCLPLAWSPYVFTSGVYAVPHNLGWWGVLAVLLLALRPTFDRTTLLAGGLLLWALVMVRQIHVWAALPLAAAAWWGGDGDGIGGGSGVGGASARIRRVAFVGLAALPAALALAYFVRLWGGLAPATEQIWVRPTAGPNLSALAMMLAVAGFAGPFVVPSLAPGLPRGWWRWAVLGGALAAVVAAAAATDFDEAAGRWGGLWALARLTPPLGGRSPAIVALAVLGGAALAVALAAVDRRQRVVVGAAALGFAAAHAAVNQAWQRYYEPMVLIGLAVCAASAWQPAPRPGQGPHAVPEGRSRSLGRVSLTAVACLQAGLTVHAFRG